MQWQCSVLFSGHLICKNWKLNPFHVHFCAINEKYVSSLLFHSFHSFIQQTHSFDFAFWIRISNHASLSCHTGLRAIPIHLVLFWMQKKKTKTMSQSTIYQMVELLPMLASLDDSLLRIQTPITPSMCVCVCVFLQFHIYINGYYELTV